MLPCPPFSITKPRFDMDTYMGRTFYFFSTINPLLCFETSNSLNHHKELLDRVAAGEKDVADDRRLWKARTAREICVHPTTGEVIFAPYRMCAFLPVNSFVVPFMMAPTTIASPVLTIFIQWFNQSYNCAVNYANRSSDKQPLSELSKAYIAAVGVSVTGALGATSMLNRVKGGTLQATIVRATLPFTAVSAAAIVNLALMRKNEWMASGTGLQVTDEDGEVRGHSRIAGRQSLMMCSVTRITWNLISMVLPLLVMRPLLARCSAVRARPAVYETGLQIGSLGVGVPLALGAFSTTVSVRADHLEPELHGLKRRDGTPVQVFTYYKGL